MANKTSGLDGADILRLEPILARLYETSKVNRDWLRSSGVVALKVANEVRTAEELTELEFALSEMSELSRDGDFNLRFGRNEYGERTLVLQLIGSVPREAKETF